MLGMEMMFSNLIGMTPDQIKDAATKTMQLIESAAKSMVQIEETQKRIEEKLDALLDEKGIEVNGKRVTGKSGNDYHVQL